MKHASSRTNHTNSDKKQKNATRVDNNVVDDGKGGTRRRSGGGGGNRKKRKITMKGDEDCDATTPNEDFLDDALCGDDDNSPDPTKTRNGSSRRTKTAMKATAEETRRRTHEKGIADVGNDDEDDDVIPKGNGVEAKPMMKDEDGRRHEHKGGRSNNNEEEEGDRDQPAHEDGEDDDSRDGNRNDGGDDDYATTQPSATTMTTTTTTCAIQQKQRAHQEQHQEERYEQQQQQQQQHEEGQEQQPLPKYDILQRVYARDKDGLIYEAIVRRQLYGACNDSSITTRSCFFSSSSRGNENDDDGVDVDEMDAADSTTTGSWHYFVHYLKWNVNWDRWVSERDVYPDHEYVKRHARRVRDEHTLLRRKMLAGEIDVVDDRIVVLDDGGGGGGTGTKTKTTYNKKMKKGKNKKLHQLIDGAKFLSAWKCRLMEIAKDFDPEKMTTTSDEQEDAERDDERKHTEKGSPFPSSTTTATSNKQIARGNNSVQCLDDVGDIERGSRKKVTKKSTNRKHRRSWTRSAMSNEMKLRAEGLSTKRGAVHAGMISLPYTLKRILVEQWELIAGPSRMVSCLPTSDDCTVESVLRGYLATKKTVDDKKDDRLTQSPKVVGGGDGVISEKSARHTITESTSTTNDESRCEETTSSGKTEKRTVTTTVNEKERIAAMGENFRLDVDAAKASNPSLAAAGVGGRKNHGPNIVDVSQESQTTMRNSKQHTANEPDSMEDKLVDREWVNMVEGIIKLFDEALPKQLLYRQERIQAAVLVREHSDSATKRPSEMYGCEHLLRLLVRLPEMLTDRLSAERLGAQQHQQREETELRSKLAKVQDLIRYLHRHEETLFRMSHRRWTGEEARHEQREAKIRERKRKRLINHDGKCK